MGILFSTVSYNKVYNPAIADIGIDVDKNSLTKENFVKTIYEAICEKNKKKFGIQNKSYYQAVIDDLWKVSEKLQEISGSKLDDTELTEFVIKSSGNISLTVDDEKKAQQKAPNAAANPAANPAAKAAANPAANPAANAPNAPNAPISSSAINLSGENLSKLGSPELPISAPVNSNKNAAAKAAEKAAANAVANASPSPNEKKLYTNIEKKLKELQKKMEEKTRQDFKTAMDNYIEGLKNKSKSREPTIQGIGKFNFQYLINLFLIIQKLKGVTGEGSDNNLKELIKKYIYIESVREKVTNETYKNELDEYKQNILQQQKIKSIQYFNKYFEKLINSFWSNTSNNEIGMLKLKNNNAKVV